MQTLDALDAFAIPGQLQFRPGPGGLIFVDIDNAGGSASIALQGAHLATFRPKAQVEPVVWLSDAARFERSKSIRGGVPVCWPWFGAHATRPAFPAHGFARTAPWSVVDAAAGQGATDITLQLDAQAVPAAQWPHDTPLRLHIRVSDALEMRLETTNSSAAPLQLGEALHTYFRVSDVGAVSLHGLDGCDYLDKVEAFARSRQSGAVRFTQETDRVYVGTAAECVIDDPVLRRRIRIAKSGSASTVVWNPWTARAAAMGDFGSDGWRRMLCVESANAWDDVLTLAPGAVHALTVRYTAEPA